MDDPPDAVCPGCAFIGEAVAGVALRDSLRFGRWASKSLCREYVKCGEVVLFSTAILYMGKQRYLVIVVSHLAGVVLRVVLLGGHVE